jgi:hypothetical protein
MIPTRLAAPCCRMILAIFLIASVDAARAQDVWTPGQPKVASDPGSRSPESQSRWQRLRQALGGRRNTTPSSERNHPAITGPSMPAELPPVPQAATNRIIAGPGTTRRPPPNIGSQPNQAGAASVVGFDGWVMKSSGQDLPPPLPDSTTPSTPGVVVPPDGALPQPDGVQPPDASDPSASMVPEDLSSGPSEPVDNRNLGFGRRLFDAYFGKEELEEEAEESYRFGTEIPFTSPPFPFAAHVGPVVGYRDTSVYPFMEAIYNGPHGDWWKKSRIKIYGWADPSYNASTSRNSNTPMAYNIVPNSLELSQFVWIFERVTDSYQTDQCDWGFKWTNLVGIDYRYTTAKGWFSDQLLKHNNLYGYDPLQLYVDLYVPKVFEGMIVRLGRYISPIDIEAQLSPENYLYTHSIMYTYDPYTFTGLQFITRLSKNWTYIMGVQAGNDMAPWTAAAQPNGEFLLKWVSDSGRNSLFGGVDSIGKGYYSHGHDDLQVAAMTWGHMFNERFHTLTESYYIWERDSRVGGTVTYGPPFPFFEAVGPGARLPGLSDSFGIVNYTAYKTSDKSYVVFRSDCLDDPRGFRTGFPGAYFEHTLGFAYHITPWCLTRPEVRFDYTSGQKAFDNGTRREQFTFSWDVIVRF